MGDRGTKDDLSVELSRCLWHVVETGGSDAYLEEDIQGQAVTFVAGYLSKVFVSIFNVEGSLSIVFTHYCGSRNGFLSTLVVNSIHRLKMENAVAMKSFFDLCFSIVFYTFTLVSGCDRKTALSSS
jgi:hypothetical protein